MKYATFAIAMMAVALVSLPANATTGSDLQQRFHIVEHESANVLQVARRGADDPANHDINDDKGGNRPGNGGKGRGGHDDGPNHA